MRIFYDFQIFALQRRGGISRYFLSLWKAFGRSGEVSPELFLGLNQTALDAELPPTVRVKGPRCKDPQWPRSRRAAWKLNAWQCGQQLRRSAAAVYHPTYFWLPGDLRGKALVITVYDLIHELFPEQFSPSDWAYRWRPAAMARADRFLAISETTKRDLCEHYNIAPERVAVTPLASSLPHVALGQRPVDRPYLLYVGERRGYKNFAVLADAWRRSEWLRRDFSLVCFGGPAPSAEERQLPGRVQFVTGDDPLLARYYRHAHALISPALYEGFGLPVVEAFALECPVITSGGGALSEVGADVALYFDPASPDSLLEAIERTAESATRASMIGGGLRRAREFSWSRCAELTRAAYVSIN